MKNAKKCKKLKFKIMLIYTCSKAKISRRIRFWSQNWAIFNRFLAKWNFSYFLWFFVFFWKSFRKLIWNRFFRRTLPFLEAICKFWWTCSFQNLVSYFPDECQVFYIVQMHLYLFLFSPLSTPSYDWSPILVLSYLF